MSVCDASHRILGITLARQREFGRRNQNLDGRLWHYVIGRQFKIDGKISQHRQGLFGSDQADFGQCRWL